MSAQRTLSSQMSKCETNNQGKRLVACYSVWAIFTRFPMPASGQFCYIYSYHGLEIGQGIFSRN